ncbi:FAD-binding oxidoreductase [Yoonia sp. I 8.24]|uniref:NAD(P)/FAD-dependent oxidoreductase n=1 Tax=Yoonia sp. I 8.24 TaxID=1537229 RepID=UPI001EE0E65E|nr:FAD-binding oxidoreductase [Yoonia sp. I 8.24]MCG3266527.1 FAD-binding oxidoreductase [Yoonia sp. I 8.24]
MKSFPISINDPIKYPGPPPAQADAVVIGGGIIGVMTGWEIAKQGLKVVVLEKGRIAAEQSSRNWGWVRVQGRDPAEIPIMQESATMWRDMNDAIGAEIGLRQGGVSFLAKTKEDLDRYASWLPDAKANGVDTRVVSKSSLTDVLPGAHGDWAGALWTPGDLRAEPWTAVPAIARAATDAGVTFVENCAARLLDLEGGRVTGVVTESGLIKTNSVVVAGGAWSSLFLRRHGVNIPQLSVRATVSATAPVDNVHNGAAVDHQLAFRRRQDGGYTLAPAGFHELFVGPDAFRALAKFAPQLVKDPLGTRLKAFAPKGFPDAWGTARRWAADKLSPFEKMRVLDPKPNAAKVRFMARAFQETYPGLDDVKIETAWAGMIDTMPDIVPVVDRVETIPGLTISTGMCGHGFGIGPAFGRITAQLATGKTPSHDITRFRLSRFSDGSKLVLGPNL